MTVVGPSATDVYYNRTAETCLAKIHERLADGSERIVHRMGDLGYFDAQRRLWFCGRKTHRVETVQGPLYTEQVEPVFNVIDGVRRTALVGIGTLGAQRRIVLRGAARCGCGCVRTALACHGTGFYTHCWYCRCSRTSRVPGGYPS